MELVVQFPARDRLKCYYAFSWCVVVVTLPIYCRSTSRVKPPYITFVSRAFMAGVASQAGDADSSRAPGLISGLQESVNVHRVALLLVPQ